MMPIWRWVKIGLTSLISHNVAYEVCFPEITGGHVTVQLCHTRQDWNIIHAFIFIYMYKCKENENHLSRLLKRFFSLRSGRGEILDGPRLSLDFLWYVQARSVYTVPMSDKASYISSEDLTETRISILPTFYKKGWNKVAHVMQTPQILIWYHYVEKWPSSCFIILICTLVLNYSS